MAFCGHWGILRINIVLKILIMAKGAVVVGEGHKKCCRG